LKPYLLDNNLGTASSFAGEAASFDLLETNDAIFCGVDGEVAAQVCARAGLLGLTNLTNDNFARANLLAAKAFNAKALTRAVVDVLT
jgi:hypothetical protein